MTLKISKGFEQQFAGSAFFPTLHMCLKKEVISLMILLQLFPLLHYCFKKVILHNYTIALQTSEFDYDLTIYYIHCLHLRPRNCVNCECNYRCTSIGLARVLCQQCDYNKSTYHTASKSTCYVFVLILYCSKIKY